MRLAPASRRRGRRFLRRARPGATGTGDNRPLAVRADEAVPGGAAVVRMAVVASHPQAIGRIRLPLGGRATKSTAQ